MKVEVVYALPQLQRSVVLELEAGATVQQAVSQSGLLALHPELGAGPLLLGVFGQTVGPERELREGDRVELHRPLQADPKEVRRRLAAEGKSMGRRGPAS